MGLITLLTDFGHRDSYVGVMKGVIASISDHAQVVDLTHDIQPQAILAARFNLLTSYEYFPAETIHVAVVDPGVGTRRRAIATQISTQTGRQIIVAPDNGMLTGFPITAAVELTQSDYWLTSGPSNTFHGRDIFAPVAAHLANGVPLAKLGPSISAADLVCLDIGAAVSTPTGYDGSIQYSDRFGNLITNIPGENLRSRPWLVSLGDHRLPYYSTYGQTEPGTALALIGSHGYVELAINGGSAETVMAAQIGDPVKLVYGT